MSCRFFVTKMLKVIQKIRKYLITYPFRTKHSIDLGSPTFENGVVNPFFADKDQYMRLGEDVNGSDDVVQKKSRCVRCQVMFVTRAPDSNPPFPRVH